MSNFKVEILPIQVIAHPNADALELALVGPPETAYRCVVPKGKFISGDLAAYIPEGAIMPENLLEEMGLTGALAGSKKNRVKAIRLRGEVSQGLVWMPERGWQRWLEDLVCSHSVRYRMDELEGLGIGGFLGITKHVPVVPACMAGKMLGDAPAFADHTDMDNIKQYSYLFAPGEMVYATEKVHGTQISIIFDGETFKVSSKGVLHKNRATLTEEPGNLYWQAFRNSGIEKGLRDLMTLIGKPFQLVGEVYGKVQDLTYGMENGGHKFAAFDLRICGADNVGRYVDSLDFFSMMRVAEIPTVPILYNGPFNIDTILGLTEGTTVIGGGVHMREGVVVKPARERSDYRHGRVILKSVSNTYLLRKGNVTELE